MRLVLVPSSQGSLGKNIGCEHAPEILSRELEDSLADLDLDVVKACVVPSDIERTDENIYKSAKEALGLGRAVFLGGDHSITYPIFRAFSEKFGANGAALLMFDAHPDCVQFFKPLSHEDFVQGLVKERMVRAENIFMMGVRKIHAKEMMWLEKNKIKRISSRAVRANLEKAKQKMCEFLQGKGIENLYITIDIDVLDPEESAGTGYLEKDGLSKRALMELLEAALESGKARAVDIVEVNPKKDAGGKTQRAAIELLEKSLNLLE
ncbi:MAG: arginase family protein [Candidatus Diapherotrites archaeon]|nr:arginase family protein [Candidatus Micrarchaeota archaeon]MBU1939984.1 arginase family protein [Candidatus Micrarchaeota archaeon]